MFETTNANSEMCGIPQADGVRHVNRFPVWSDGEHRTRRTLANESTGPPVTRHRLGYTPSPAQASARRLRQSDADLLQFAF